MTRWPLWLLRLSECRVALWFLTEPEWIARWDPITDAEIRKRFWMNEYV